MSCLHTTNQDRCCKIMATLHALLESKEWDDPIDSMDAVVIRRLVVKAMHLHPEFINEITFCEHCGAAQ